MVATSLTQRQVSQAMGRLVINGAFFSMLVGGLAVVQMFRFGWSQDYLWLLLGSCASIAGMYTYSMTAYASGERSVFWMLMAFSGLLPFLFGCYLVFVRGLWGLVGGVSAYGLARTVGFVVVGYGIVHSTYRLTEFVDAIRKGTISVG